MEEQLIIFDTAKLAKEKGFKICPDKHYYTEDGKLTITSICSYAWHELNEERGTDIIASTQALLQKWLREKHNIIVQIEVDCTSKPKYCYSIYKYSSDTIEWERIGNKYSDLYRSYEEALEKGLQEGSP